MLMATDTTDLLKVSSLEHGDGPSVNCLDHRQLHPTAPELGSQWGVSEIHTQNETRKIGS